MKFDIGDEVEWDMWMGFGVERGKIIEMRAMYAQVEYGPWCDTLWIHVEKLRRRS